MKRIFLCVSTILALLCLAAAVPAARAQAKDDIAMKAMRDELARSMTMHLPGLAKPYFVVYRIQDVTDSTVVASLGAVASDQTTRSRLLQVDVRVGDYKLDNTNFLSGRARGFGGVRQISLDDDYLEIRRQIWLATDARYKLAVSQFAAKQAALQNQNGTEDLPDFTQEKPGKYYEAPKPALIDDAALQSLARQVSAVFRQTPELQSSAVTVSVHEVKTRFLNSEGTEYTRSNTVAFAELRAALTAADGMPLEDSTNVFAESQSGLSSSDLIARAQQMSDRLRKVRAAGTLERYNGPVLFEGEAAAEIFAQLFAPGLAATRNPTSDNPQAVAFMDQMASRLGGASLADNMGARVLPDFVSVVDNPQLDSYEGKQLLGSYKVDDDGVPSRVSRLVDSGILKSLLTARTPVTGILQSSGSHRGVSAAPSNLIVTATKPSTDGVLRRLLLERAKTRGYDYGLIVRHTGSTPAEFVQTEMSIAQGGSGAGTSLLEVYKVYEDGREELVHGLQLPVASVPAFKDIVAAGDKPVVYNSIFVPGFSSLVMMGAGGGDGGALSSMPLVSYVVPSLLFEDVSLKATPGPFPKPPVLDAPPLSAGN